MFDRRSYMKQYYHRQYWTRVREHRCTACGIELDATQPRKRCEKCMERQNENSRKSRQNQKRKIIRGTK